MGMGLLFHPDQLRDILTDLGLPAAEVERRVANTLAKSQPICLHCGQTRERSEDPCVCVGQLCDACEREGE
jgi:hypothetical protein